MITPPKKVGNTKRLQWIDAAKGIAILGVLLIHIGRAPIGNYDYHAVIFNYLFYIVAPFMPLFFFLSGITFSDKKGIIKKRATQIVIPYVSWALFYYAIYNTRIIYSNQWTIDEAILKFVGILYGRSGMLAQGSGPMWFLTALFSSYVLYLPIHRTKTRKYRICLICLYSLILTMLYTTQFLLPWNLDTAFAGAILIHAGYCCKKFGIFENPSSKTTIIASIAAIPIYITSVNLNGGGWGMFMRNLGNSGYLSPLLFLCMGICGSFLFCLFSLCLEKLKLSSILATIGRHTLTILCSHYFIYGIATPIIVYSISLHPSLQAMAPYCFILQISAAIIFAILFDKLKMPAMRMFNKRLQRIS